MDIMCKVKIVFIFYCGKVWEVNEDCIGLVNFLIVLDLGFV